MQSTNISLAQIKRNLRDRVSVINDLINETNKHSERLYEIYALQRKCTGDYEALIDLHKEHEQIRKELDSIYAVTDARLKEIRERNNSEIDCRENVHREKIDFETEERLSELRKRKIAESEEEEKHVHWKKFIAKRNNQF